MNTEQQAFLVLMFDFLHFHQMFFSANYLLAELFVLIAISFNLCVQNYIFHFALHQQMNCKLMAGLFISEFSVILSRQKLQQHKVIMREKLSATVNVQFYGNLQ